MNRLAFDLLPGASVCGDAMCMVELVAKSLNTPALKGQVFAWGLSPLPAMPRGKVGYE